MILLLRNLQALFAEEPAHGCEMNIAAEDGDSDLLFICKRLEAEDQGRALCDFWIRVWTALKARRIQRLTALMLPAGPMVLKI